MPKTSNASELLVRDYMTKKVFTIRVDKKLIVVKDIMDWAHIRHVPVVDESNKLVGIVSHRDLLAASLAMVDKVRTEFDRKNWLAHVLVKDVMRKSILAVRPTAHIAQVAKLMRSRKIGCVPVIDNDKLVGIITEHDLLELVERLCS